MKHLVVLIAVVTLTVYVLPYRSETVVAGMRAICSRTLCSTVAAV